MINEKKLLKKLEELKFANEEKGYDTAKDVVQECIEIVKNQPQADKWIPCEERLPSENGLYLATYECEDEITVDVMFFMGKQFYYPEDMIGIVGKSVEVIAWQPLPQPYKADHHGEVNGMVTNADRIRNMTDGELAVYLSELQEITLMRNKQDSVEDSLKWLQSEVRKKGNE